jgi:FAD/FMN-containing dehydrogenase
MYTHEQKVHRIAGQLKGRTSIAPLTFKKKTVSHQVPKPRDKRYSDEKLDISDLNEILIIDPKEKICIAEPGVTFQDLVKATLPYRLVPMTVPEHKAITIGGAVAGGSLESMSYKYGGFHDSCIEYEVITAKGDVLVCSLDQNSLLFQMVNGTFGTLGLITKLKFKLIPARNFVMVMYKKYGTFEEYSSAIGEHYQKQDVDFMDGIIFSPTEYALNIGNFVDDVPFAHNYDWTRSYFLSMKTGADDYLSTLDYFFRYDKGITSVFPKSFLGRLLIGKFVGSTTTLKLADTLRRFIPPETIPVTVDVFIPFSKASTFIDWYIKEIDFFPLWCVPYKTPHRYEWISSELFDKTNDALFLDLAIYEMRKKDKNYYRILEEKLLEIGGLKALISNNYYTESEFWETFNKENYFTVKQQTDPDNILRDIYDKTCAAAMGLSK